MSELPGNRRYSQIVRNLAGAMALCVLYLVTEVIGVPAQSFQSVKSSRAVSESVLLDRVGQVINETRIDYHARSLSWVPLSDISPALVSEVLRSEDRRFFRHRGVDYRSLYRAVWDSVRGSRRGGSTVSAQVASLAVLKHRPRTAIDKLRQFYVASRIEQTWTKAEILDAYLNLVPFRGEYRGIRAISRALFQKEPLGITRNEAQLLAILIRAPNASLEQIARRLCTDQRLKVGGEDCIQEQSQALKILSAPKPIIYTENIAPHVAQRLLSRERETRVHSTLDGELQRFALGQLREQLSQLKRSNVRDGAVLVVDNKSGDVLAYVGNSGDTASAQYVDGVRARRLAGSTLKPFLYAQAIESHLLTAASVLDDSPMEVPVFGGVYRPRNYDNAFHGPVLLGTALGSSLNVPAVKTLNLIGVEEFHGTLKALGFEGLRSWEVYGSSLALGSAEVSLWELTNAYRAIANGGVWSSILLQKEQPQVMRRVFSSGTAFILADLLSSRENRMLTFDTSGPLSTRFWSMVKTGTSKDMTDNWCVGGTDRFTVGVWVGNFSGQPMWDVSGTTGAAPLWSEITSWLYDNRASSKPPVLPSEDVVVRNIEFAGSHRELYFLHGTEPAEVDGRSIVVTGAPRLFPAIVYPTADMTVALDPGIPEARERLPLEAVHAPEGSLFVLDDSTQLGSAQDIVYWPPLPGRHELRIVSAQGDTLAMTSFLVRGAGAGMGAKE